MYPNDLMPQTSAAPRKRRADRTRAELVQEEAAMPVRTTRRADRSRALAQEEVYAEAAAFEQPPTPVRTVRRADRSRAMQEEAAYASAEAYAAPVTTEEPQRNGYVPAPQKRETNTQDRRDTRASSENVGAVSARSMAAVRSKPMRSAAEKTDAVSKKPQETEKVKRTKDNRAEAEKPWGAATMPKQAKAAPARQSAKKPKAQAAPVAAERNGYGVPAAVKQEQLGSQGWFDMPRQPEKAVGNAPQEYGMQQAAQGYGQGAYQGYGYPQNGYGAEQAGNRSFDAARNGQQPAEQAYARAQNGYGADAVQHWQQPMDNAYARAQNGYPAYGAQHAAQGSEGGQPPYAAYPSFGGDNGGQVPPQKLSRQGGGEPPHGGKKPRPWKRIVIIGIVALVLCAGAGIGGSSALRYYAASNAVTPYDNVFCQGVYVDGISLGGMTPEAAMAAVQQQSEQRSASWSVRLTYGGQVAATITADQLGMSVDFADVMNTAWKQGHTGDIYDRKAAQDALLETPYEAFTAMPSGDTSVVDTLLEELKNNVYRAAQDAQVLSFDPSLTYPFTFQDEVEGRVLDVSGLKEKIYQMVSTLESGDVEIVPDVIAPSVTVAELKQNYAVRASVYTPIDRHSTDNRNNNIRRCFEKINGYVLAPGYKFSFNNVVGKRTLANGFYEAIEYAYGEHVMGVGGGACQASTTLYQAVVEANLTVNNRVPHSDSVSYASYGEDATVSWTTGRKIDLAFTNSTSHDLYFVAAVETDPSNSKRLIARVTIYGEAIETGVRYELQSETIQTLSAPSDPTYVKDKEAEYVTYTDQEYVYSKAKEGYVVESYLVKYVNEEVAERTLLYTDTYKAKAQVIYVGVTKRD